jgi:hypothetical protein
LSALASLSSRHIFEFMAGTGGQLVSVSTPSVEGGTPTYSAVVVVEPDPKKFLALAIERQVSPVSRWGNGPVPSARSDRKLLGGRPSI